MSARAIRERWLQISTLGLAFCCFFFALWSGSLLDSDDVIYADMARTAWRSGDFLGLRWHNAVLFEKPPLLFWSVALFGGAFGFSDLVVRLPGALAGFMTVALVGALALRMSGEKLQGAVAALLLLSSYTFVFHSRRVLADPLFMLAMYAALFSWISACSQEGKAGRRSAVLAGGFLGLCVMTKWVFVVLPLLSMAAWHGVERRRIPWSKVGWVGASGLAVALPWHILQSVHHGEAFWEVYAGYHVWERATRSLVNPHGPLYYFELVAATDVGFLSLAGAGLLGSVLAWRSGARGALTPWAMCLVCFLPLQISSTKMPHYLLALAPLVALGGARGWGWLFVRWRSPALRVALGALLVGAWATGPFTHIVSPDYSPATKKACSGSGSGAGAALVINHYNPAATWYCDQPVVMHTDDPRFYELQQSIDMMARSKAVALLSTPEIVALVVENPSRPVITRPGYGARLRALLPQEHGERKLMPGKDADVLEAFTHEEPVLK